ncbi:MAG: hypothetical protein J0M08_05485 [Bacteroidetes bacterium]|nr:hypothetical protein [Bacteroidota bacterium]
MAILLLFAAREAIYIGIRKNEIGEFDKLNTIFIKKNNFDVLLVGSSRMESHVHPGIIDSVCHTSSYNIGMDGGSLPFVYGVFKSYLVNSATPKVVVFNIDMHSYSLKKIVINRFPRYFPYLKNKELHTVCSALDERFPYFKYIPMYSLPYLNDTYLNASVRGYFGKKSEFDKAFYKGYVPIPQQLHQNVDTVTYKIFASPTQPIIFESFDSTIALCNKLNTRLVFVISPMYYKGSVVVSNLATLKKEFMAKAAEKNIRFIDYSTDTMCFNPSFFADPYHLNTKGAYVFSTKLASDLKQYLK